MHALGVEGEDFGVAFGAVRWEFLSVQEETDCGGVADSYDQFAPGMESGCGGSDQCFLGDELSVGGDRDRCVFAGADQQTQLDRRLLGRFRRRIALGTDGYVAFLFDLDCVRVLLPFRLDRRGRRAIGRWRIWCGGA